MMLGRGFQSLRLGYCGEVETRVSIFAHWCCNDAEARLSSFELLVIAVK